MRLAVFFFFYFYSVRFFVVLVAMFVVIMIISAIGTCVIGSLAGQLAMPWDARSDRQTARREVVSLGVCRSRVTHSTRT